MMNSILSQVNLIKWEVLVAAASRIALTLALAWIAAGVVRKLIAKFKEHLLNRSIEMNESVTESSKRIQTITRLIRQAIFIALWVIVALVILQEIGIEIGPLLAGAGIAGVAVGFGGQNLVRDVISGFFFIIENQVRVGDMATINGTSGTIESINLRTIVMRDLAGVVHVFPNGTITTMSNMTKDWSAYVFDLSVAYKEDIDKVMNIIENIGKKMKEDQAFGDLMLDVPEIFGVDKLANTSVVIKGRIRTRPSRQLIVGREFLRRVKYAFDSENIVM